MKYVMGIDPGTDGAITIINVTNGAVQYRVFPHRIEIGKTKKTRMIKGVAMKAYPEKRKVDYADVARILSKISGDVLCVGLEHNQEAVGDASQYAYGWSNGIMLGLLMGLGFNIVLLPPRTWQKCINPTFKAYRETVTTILTKGKNKGKSVTKVVTRGFKTIALDEATKIFPNERFCIKGGRVPHKGIVDSALIAHVTSTFFGFSKGGDGI